MTVGLMSADSAGAVRAGLKLSQTRRKGTQGTLSLGQCMKADRQMEGSQELRPGAEDTALVPAMPVSQDDLGQVPVINVLNFLICRTCG